MPTYVIFFLGILVDIFIGELLGQYILAFLIIYMGSFTLHKFFKFQSYSQIVFLYLILLELGFLVLTTTSLTYQLNNNDITLMSMGLTNRPIVGVLRKIER